MFITSQVEGYACHITQGRIVILLLHMKEKICLSYHTWKNIQIHKWKDLFVLS